MTWLRFWNKPSWIIRSICRFSSEGRRIAIRELCFLIFGHLVKHLYCQTNTPYFVVKLKTQIVYKTNLDLEATENNIRKSGVMASYITQKGLLWFRFKETGTIFVASSNRLQVKWDSPDEKRLLFKLVKNLLVPRQGETLKTTPSQQQLQVPYPPPEEFKLYWCDETTEYEKKPNSQDNKEIRSEISGIRECYVSNDTVEAGKRLMLLVNTMLPTEWKDELEPLIGDFNRQLKEANSESRALDNSRKLRVEERFIPRFLKEINRLMQKR